MDPGIFHDTATAATQTPAFMGMPLAKATVVIAFAALINSAVVGFGQIGLIIWGLAQMSSSSSKRDKQLDAQDRKTDELIAGLQSQTQALQALLARLQPPAPDSPAA